jgi:hypothetical protein
MQQRRAMDPPPDPLPGSPYGVDVDHFIA